MTVTFFRWVWRFNAVAIAIIVLILVGISVANMANRHDDNEVVVSTGDLPREHSSSDPFLSEDVVEGSLFRTIRVGGQPYNMLLIDDRNGSSRYALPDNSRDIIQWHNLPRAEDPPATVQAYVALVNCEAPQANGGKCYDVLVGRFDPAIQAWVARGVTALEWPKLIGDESVAMLVWIGDDLRYLKVSLLDLKPQILRSIPLMKPREAGR